MIGHMESEGWHADLRPSNSGSVNKQVIRKLPDRLVFAYNAWRGERDIPTSIVLLDSWLEGRLKVELKSESALAKDPFKRQK